MSDDVDVTIDQLIAAGADDAEIQAIIREKYGNRDTGPVQPGTNSALTLSGMARAGIPAAANAAERFFTSPTVPKTTALMGRIIGGAAPIAGGASLGGPAGALLGTGQVSKAAYAGGRTGYFTGKLLQNMAEPVAKGLRAAVPYAEAAGKMAGPQGLLDLAQMAEPNRRDIGFLGLGPSVDVPGAEPPVLNELYRRLMAKFRGQ